MFEEATPETTRLFRMPQRQPWPQPQAQPFKVNPRAQGLRNSAQPVTQTLKKTLDKAKADADFETIQARKKVWAENKAAEALVEAQRQAHAAEAQAAEAKKSSDPVYQATERWESFRGKRCLSPGGTCSLGCTVSNIKHAENHLIGMKENCVSCGEVQIFVMYFDDEAGGYSDGVIIYPHSNEGLYEGYKSSEMKKNRESLAHFIKFVKRGNLCPGCWVTTCKDGKTCQPDCDESVFLETTVLPTWVHFTCKDSKCTASGKKIDTCGMTINSEFSTSCSNECLSCGYSE